jgi:hypothetical protein
MSTPMRYAVTLLRAPKRPNRRAANVHRPAALAPRSRTMLNCE